MRFLVREVAQKDGTDVRLIVYDQDFRLIVVVIHRVRSLGWTEHADLLSLQLANHVEVLLSHELSDLILIVSVSDH